MHFDRRALVTAMAAIAAAPAFAQPIPAALQSETGTAPLARRLANYIDSMRVTDLDPATIERAKIHLLDSLGCGIAAVREVAVTVVCELEFASVGNAATIVGTNRRAALEWAVFANGAGIRADDM